MSDDLQSEGEVPITHQSTQGGAVTPDAVADTDERIKEVYQLQREHPELFLRICKRMQNNTQRGVLTAVANKEVATYEDMEDVTTVSRRSLRNAVNRLEEDGIVSKRNSRMVVVSFPNDHTELLVKEALTMFFDIL
jgi:Cdc6-like AAA superfamily ATPase